MSPHTSEPWEVQISRASFDAGPGAPPIRLFRVVDSAGQLVATIEALNAAGEAIAHLIAEAPEMKDQMILCANHLRSLAEIGRTLTAADVAAIEHRVREARLTLERAVSS